MDITMLRTNMLTVEKSMMKKADRKALRSGPFPSRVIPPMFSRLTYR
jgi:hypothetical protein